MILLNKDTHSWLLSIMFLLLAIVTMTIPLNIRATKIEQVKISETKIENAIDLQDVPADLGDEKISVNILTPGVIVAIIVLFSFFYNIYTSFTKKESLKFRQFKASCVIWEIPDVLNAITVVLVITFLLSFFSLMLFFRQDGMPVWFQPFMFILAEVIGVLYIIRKFRGRRVLKGLGVWGRNIAAKIKFGILYFYKYLYLFFLILIIWNSFLNMFHDILGFDDSPSAQQIVFFSLIENKSLLVLLTILSFTIVPVVEEFFFRGLIYGSLRKYLSVNMSAFICAICFGLVHNSIRNFLPIMFLGFVLCIIREKTNSLYAPIAVHGLYNASVITLIASMFL